MSKQPIETTCYSLSSMPPARSDRRSGERYVRLLRVGALVIDGRRELCLVRNISAGGMLIRPYSPVASGTRVSIELKHGNSISGVAQWSDGGVVGISFDQQIDVLALLTPSGASTQPRMPRIELNCAAWVRQDGDIYRTRALNISQGGIRVSGAPDLSLGADVIISVPGLAPSAGVVRWKVGDEYGIGFNRVFAVDELMAFLRLQRDNQLQQMAG